MTEVKQNTFFKFVLAEHGKITDHNFLTIIVSPQTSNWSSDWIAWWTNSAMSGKVSNNLIAMRKHRTNWILSIKFCANKLLFENLEALIKPLLSSIDNGFFFCWEFCWTNYMCRLSQDSYFKNVRKCGVF